MRNNLNTYLTERFNYNPEIDTINDTKAKEELSSFDYQIKYKSFKNISKIIKDNFDYKFFIPSLDSDEYYDYDKLSPAMAIYWYEYNHSIKGIDKQVYELIMNLQKDEIKGLSKYKRVGLEMIELIYIQMGNFPDLYSVFDIKYMDGCYGYEAQSLKLKDPFYDFPELKEIRKIQGYFNVSNNAVIKLLRDEIHDYATYSIGDTNSDMREEFIMYYHDFLEPAILNNNNDKEIREKIDTLESYLEKLETHKRESRVLSYCKVPQELESAKSSMKMRLDREISFIPSKYKSIEAVNKEIDRLLSF